MGLIWGLIVVISIIFGLLMGNVEIINKVILTTSYEALLSFGMIAANIILWSGILRVAMDGALMIKVCKYIRPIIKPLFKTKYERALDLIAANLTCNLLALGSASTPFGIKAMQELAKKESKESLWDMETLVLINVCGFTLMPSSLLALRMNYGGEDNELVIFYCILISLITTVIILSIHFTVRRWR